MKKVFYKKLVFSLVLISSVFFWSFQSNDPITQKILTYFNKLQAEFPTEKVYLHLDKHTYTLGEDIWFSAYVTAGGNQIPSPLSRTLYVDLFNGEGVLVGQRKVLIEDGFGKGDFKLPDFGIEGVYRIKAYTAWMENFGDDFFYHKEIEVFDATSTSFFPNVTFESQDVNGDQVKYAVSLDVIDGKGNPLVDEVIQVKVFGEDEEFSDRSIQLNSQGQASFTFNLPLKPFKFQWMELTYLENETYPVIKKVKIPYNFQIADIQFLPEGGHLLEGYKSNIAFKGIYPDGSPVELEGKILDTEEVVEFKTFFAGMGKFELTPQSQRVYQARVSDPNTGEFQILNLPKVESRGMVLQVLNNPSANYVTVFVQGNYEEQDLVLVSQTRGIINYMINGSLTNGIWGVRIPKDELITGINQITILNQKGDPLLERLFFFQSEKDFVNLSAKSTAISASRGPIEIEIETFSQNEPVLGSYSVSITDLDQVSNESILRGNIISDLLLTSDLKGNIHLPGYYFKDQEPGTLEALDLVMMTNGWRRFDWGSVMEDKFPTIDKFIERGITIEGTIIDQEKSKRGLRGGKVSAMVGQGIDMVTSEYGPNGRFILMELEYLDTAQVTITAEDLRVKNFVDITIEQPKPYFLNISPRMASDIKIPAELIATYQERTMMNRLFDEEKIIDLDGVTVEGQTLEREDEQMRKIYGVGDVTIDPEKILGSVAFTNVFQMIQGRVSGVQVFFSGMSVTVQIRGVGSLQSGGDPLYLLDNMPVDAGTMMLVNPQDVASVDVFKDPAKAAIFGAQGANGVIAVYTKTGFGGAIAEVPGKLITKYGGYSAAREFYQPNYETKTAENAIPDKRSTIYWNPNLKIDESGKAKIKYYNTDIAKKHLIVIEGMDAQGRLARFEKILE